MFRWRTWLVLLGLVLATPLVSGCLTTAIVSGVRHVLRDSDGDKPKHDADSSRAKKHSREKHESTPRHDPPPVREAPEEPDQAR